MHRLGNSIFFIGLILITLAVILGMPLFVPIAVVAIVLLVVGGWLWSKPKPHRPEEGVPLSQQPPTNKILAAIPAVIILAFSTIFEEMKALGHGVTLLLFAYALVGVIELKFEKNLSGAKRAWDLMPKWKVFVISLMIIVGSFIMFMAAIPFVAKLIYK